jgi:hypothetical protein
LTDRLTARQLADWMAYRAVEPWGDEAANHRMARIVWAILQKGNKRRVNERDYLLAFAPPQQNRPTALDRMKTRAMQITRALDGTIELNKG